MGVEGGYSAFEEKLISGYYDGENLKFPVEPRFTQNAILNLNDKQLLAAVHKYRADRKAYEADQIKYHEAVRALEFEFSRDIAEEYGMTGHPLQDLLLQKAVMLALNEGSMNFRAIHAKYQFLLELVTR